VMQQYPVPRRSQTIREIAGATGQRVVSDFIGWQKLRFGLWAAIGQEGVNGWRWDLVRRANAAEPRRGMLQGTRLKRSLLNDYR